ncbi:MAG: ABC transporter ATP-binding protein [Caldilineaceae bacterium]|nr:ABC transporter ATP-binding protein [Caldilineaceae bacterium]
MCISFGKRGGRRLPVIDAANLSLDRRQAVGIVGESGSGKTMLCRALIGTLPRHGAGIDSGTVRFDGQELAGAPERVWRGIRGREIGYIPQSSLAGLNPVLTVETQLVESIAAAGSMSRQQAREEAVALIERVQIPRAEQVLKARSHELSGGMRQRVMIAAAIAQGPKLLIADEPTTALDVTIQREILNLITQLRQELNMALILVSHDLAVIEEVCDEVMVMYAGASVEAGPVAALSKAPRHPYTRALRVSRVDRAVPGRDLEAIPGDAASVGSWPAGCRFWPRCALADEACRRDSQPALMPTAQQLSACIHAERMVELEL